MASWVFHSPSDDTDEWTGQRFIPILAEDAGLIVRDLCKSYTAKLTESFVHMWAMKRDEESIDPRVAHVQQCLSRVVLRLVHRSSRVSVKDASQ